MLCPLKPKDIAAAKALLRDPEITVVEVARRLGVVPSTLYRHLPRARTAALEARAEPCHADQARAALLLPDRLAADQPLGAVRARQGLLRGLWAAARPGGAPSGRWPLVGRGAPEPGVMAAAVRSPALPRPRSSRAGRPRSCWRRRISTTTPRTAAAGTATSRHSASGAICCMTGPSIGGGSGSPCAGAGPWVICSRASIRSDERHDVLLSSDGHPIVTPALARRHAIGAPRLPQPARLAGVTYSSDQAAPAGELLA